MSIAHGLVLLPALAALVMAGLAGPGRTAERRGFRAQPRPGAGALRRRAGTGWLRADALGTPLVLVQP
jgi:hypothetical protein